jgi:hypothetical protein
MSRDAGRIQTSNSKEDKEEDTAMVATVAEVLEALVAVESAIAVSFIISPFKNTSTDCRRLVVYKLKCQAEEIAGIQQMTLGVDVLRKVALGIRSSGVT